MPALIIKLFLAHIIGDFLFQPDAWVEEKTENKVKSKYLYLHIFVHAALMMVMLQFNLFYWKGVLFLIISHYIIDLSKTYFDNKVNSCILFFVDQIFHVIAILAVINYYVPFLINLSSLCSVESLLFLTFLLLSTNVSSVVIKMFMSRWKIKNGCSNRAGKYIGILERLFIFLMIVMDHWGMIGFLLAAKSIFRFGDLSNAKDRNLTEYVLTGTLMSFCLGVLSALGYIYFVDLSHNL